MKKLSVRTFLPSTIRGLVYSGLDSVADELVKVNPAMQKDDFRRQVVDAAYNWVSNNVQEVNENEELG